jgi:hypothetical protein
MTESSGKKRRRKTPLEGFNNVPKMLVEARQLVDAVTDAPPPAPAAAGTGPEFARPANDGPRPEMAAAPSSPEGQMPPRRRKPRAPQRPTILPQAESRPPEPKAVPVQQAALAPAKARRPPAACGIYILHRVPGRTRLRLPQLKWNVPLANNLKERLAIIPGITGVETSTVTGSAVFYYQPRELCQPSAQQALQEAWQDLFPEVAPEQLTAALLGQREH